MEAYISQYSGGIHMLVCTPTWLYMCLATQETDGSEKVE